MTLHLDPEGREIEALRTAVDWHGRRVLEIGCGDGRLARRLVRLGAQVVASDPDADEVRQAMATRPRTYRGKLAFALAEGERLPFKATSYDIVVFGWSL
jgi:2-polyprenyl-6-hydroxyphenyl methylase/3-demethylubiquinone-9 3-methyltransferase